MFSIQKFFGKDPKFFELFEKSAHANLLGALCVSEILEEKNLVNNNQQLRDARRKSKEIHAEIQELVIKTFVTSLEREDIEALSFTLYKVLKPLEKFIERHEITKSWTKNINFIEQAKALCVSADKVLEMVKLIRNSGNLELARRLNTGLQQAESDADLLEVELLRALYSDQNTDTRHILATKDLYDLLEKGIDRCRDVGNVVMHIILKNS